MFIKAFLVTILVGFMSPAHAEDNNDLEIAAITGGVTAALVGVRLRHDLSLTNQALNSLADELRSNVNYGRMEPLPYHVREQLRGAELIWEVEQPNGTTSRTFYRLITDTDLDNFEELRHQPPRRGSLRLDRIRYAGIGHRDGDLRIRAQLVRGRGGLFLIFAGSAAAAVGGAHLDLSLDQEQTSREVEFEDVDVSN